MRTSPSIPLLATLLAALAAPVGAAETVVEFDGGIGSQPLAGNPVTVTANDVRGVNPGGRPWEIRKLKATVKSDGGLASIVVRGEGLILGGGNSVGTPGITPTAPREVAATLFCGSNDGFSSSAVQTNAAGDFRIRSALTNAAGSSVLPAPCGSPTAPPVLLIRNAPGGAPGAWFAAGILKVPDEPSSD